MILFASTPTPSPTMPEDMTSATVTPGLPGFFIFFFMAVALVFLAIDMSRRIRRTTARAAVEERMKMREAKAAEVPSGDSEGSRARRDGTDSGASPEARPGS